MEVEKDVRVRTWGECEQRLSEIEQISGGEVWFRGLSNSFSLFGSEDSLMDMLAFREIDSRESAAAAIPIW